MTGLLIKELVMEEKELEEDLIGCTFVMTFSLQFSRTNIKMQVRAIQPLNMVFREVGSFYLTSVPLSVNIKYVDA